MMTIKNKYSHSLISKLVTKLQEVCYFTKLDIYQRFNNVWIKPGNKYYMLSLLIQKLILYGSDISFKLW